MAYKAFSVALFLACFFMIEREPVFSAFAEERPALHVVSLNLCTDQLLLMLSPPEDIAGLSVLSRDCSETPLCEKARSFPMIRAEGEEVLKSHPTHILEGSLGHATVQKMAYMQSLAYNQVPPVQTLNDIPAQLRALSSWLHMPLKGEALARQFEKTLQGLYRPLPRHPLKAAFYSESDDPLLEEMMARAGFVSLSGDRLDYRVFSPEKLVISPPDLLVISTLEEGASLKETKLMPGFLKKRFRGTHFLRLPMKLTLCGAPYSLGALKRLDEARLLLEKEVLMP